MTDTCSAKPIRVLLVEDNPMLLETLVRLLEKDAHVGAIATARTAEETLEMMSSFRPTVVMTDLVLDPRGEDRWSGYKVCQMVLAQPISTGLVVISGLGDPSTVRELLRAGAFAYINKADFTPQVIRNSIYGAHVNATGQPLPLQ